MRLTKILSSKKIILEEPLIKIALQEDLSLKEFLTLSYLANDFSNQFEPEKIASYLHISLEELMVSLDTLMTKGLLGIESVKDGQSRYNEIFNLEDLYRKMESTLEEEEKAEEDISVFKTIEQEWGRTLSPMELELINGWLSSGISEELIIGALKEAIYNGVKNFRYIDKIIYDWDRQGFKSMQEVESHMKNRREDKNKDKKILEKEAKILDYDWLDV